ncbi:MAG: DUF742 domain-containing protein [Streptosporangiaceae bacterium]
MPTRAPGWEDTFTPVTPCRNPQDQLVVCPVRDWTEVPVSERFEMAGGRAQSRLRLPVEAQVLAQERPAWEVGIFTAEYRSVFDTCRNWRSVAEISALCGYPLAVARGLIADMAGEGLLRVHRTTAHQPDLAVLERLLHGLRAL